MRPMAQGVSFFWSIDNLLLHRYGQRKALCGREGIQPANEDQPIHRVGRSPPTVAYRETIAKMLAISRFTCILKSLRSYTA